MRVMISAAASPAAISALRHLRGLGHRVIGMDAAVEAEFLGRAFCDEFHVSPHADSPEYLEFLSARLAEVDVFLPFIDEELIAIARGWERIAPDLAARIALSAPQVLLDCTDKCTFQRACEDAGLPIAPRALEAPALFKPRYGRGGRGLIAINDNRMFEAVQGRDGVVQRAISGEEFTIDAIFDHAGKLVATSPRRRIRSAGVSTIGEVVPDRPLHDLAARLGERWRFRYAINFQVIRDSGGCDWIIELNPRLSGSGIFSAMAGCDPYAATIALWNREPWFGEPRPLRIWRYWQEITQQEQGP
jgi:carbamoyl-phosphate synthase large subunit